MILVVFRIHFHAENLDFQFPLKSGISMSSSGAKIVGPGGPLKRAFQRAIIRGASYFG